MPRENKVLLRTVKAKYTIVQDISILWRKSMFVCYWLICQGKCFKISNLITFCFLIGSSK